MLVPIIVCEVLFWVMLVLGLLARYVARRKALSTALLVSTPFIDVVLIVITMVDLHRGADPHFTHGLSAFYIGFSIMFGPSVIRWADERAAYRWGHGPEPTRAVRTRTDEVSYQWAEWRRALTASAIAAIVLGFGIAIAGMENAFWLQYWMGVLVFLVVCWAFIGPLRASRKTIAEPDRASDTAQPSNGG
nr:hypothetical protein [uncultured Rhodococcus sp.]